MVCLWAFILRTISLWYFAPVEYILPPLSFYCCWVDSRCCVECCWGSHLRLSTFVVVLAAHHVWLWHWSVPAMSPHRSLGSCLFECLLFDLANNRFFFLFLRGDAEERRRPLLTLTGLINRSLRLIRNRASWKAFYWLCFEFSLWLFFVYKHI